MTTDRQSLVPTLEPSLRVVGGGNRLIAIACKPAVEQRDATDHPPGIAIDATVGLVRKTIERLLARKIGPVVNR